MEYPADSLSQHSSAVDLAGQHITKVFTNQPNDAFQTYLDQCRQHSLSPEFTHEVVTALPPEVHCYLEHQGILSFRARALSELRTAARAWDVPPLLLMTVFADGPRSDHFWRRLALLARRKGSSWAGDYCKLITIRRSRQNDTLVRHKGLSRTQPWTLADVEKALAGENGGGKKESQDDNRQNIINNNHESLDSHKQVALETKTDDPDSPKYDNNRTPTCTESGKQFQPRFVWPMAIGFWITRDMMHKLCTFLAPFGQDFDVVEVQNGAAAASRAVVLASPTLLLLPVQVTVPQPRWVLGTLCQRQPASTDRMGANAAALSVYDPLGMGAAGGPLNEASAAVLSLASTVWPSTTIVPVQPDIHAHRVQQQSSMNSGVGVLVAILECLLGRPCQLPLVPPDIDTWFWRRLFTRFVAHAMEDDAEIEASSVMSADHNQMVSSDSIRRLTALRVDAQEARHLWEVAEAEVSTKAESHTGTWHGVRAVLEEIDGLTAWLAKRGV